MRCSICAKPCRSRTRAQAVGADGQVKAMLACNTCAARGVLFIPTSAAKLCRCGRNVADTCNACCDAARQKPAAFQKILAGQLRRLAQAYPGARGEGLEQAADFVEAYRLSRDEEPPAPQKHCTAARQLGGVSPHWTEDEIS